ncbi:DeoR/GlpR family DNA-binding transcription regulator [Desulfosporosinus sp. BICA1-9]|uniref:DeoR/GlpR family DNA-binding transcription regulator n=1 Tax=Desulfosporosinus sp. BICA1-9 TaxID=1531958 RepID=UPI0005F22166|nr:DeoR/GlpR family DNA-binding transcription regulator [Desulfosporosinus sp. BICA1-9]KJS50831.1 MAG: hypothetical protein VR66_00645 [Peptococcaceae bacterium BRH_c23]KJS83445.1 MAG: hypothetical protein JL57_22700 [Desulfosporosinus sp. BICA1-9]HBW37375.1 DeoR/GlpR transcriptional regulator [Desulfosporosinus sp.]
MRSDRLQTLLSYIDQHEYASFSELCKEFKVSSATMRRDLKTLAQKGLIKRMHGAVKSKIDDQKYEPPLSERINMNIDEKRRIAERAMAEIKDGDSIILDSSTTVCELAKLLADSNLNITVMTNDIEIAYILAPHPIIELIAVGGYIRKGYYTSMGFFAENLWKELHADKLFLGVDAVDLKYGMMNYRIEEMSCKRLMIERAKECVVLCDHTKFTSSAVLQICPFDKVDKVITGTELDLSIMNDMQRIGVEIVRV